MATSSFFSTLLCSMARCGSHSCLTCPGCASSASPSAFPLPAGYRRLPGLPAGRTGTYRRRCRDHAARLPGPGPSTAPRIPAGAGRQSRSGPPLATQAVVAGPVIERLLTGTVGSARHFLHEDVPAGLLGIRLSASPSPRRPLSLTCSSDTAAIVAIAALHVGVILRRQGFSSQLQIVFADGVRFRRGRLRDRRASRRGTHGPLRSSPPRRSPRPRGRADRQLHLLRPVSYWPCSSTALGHSPTVTGSCLFR